MLARQRYDQQASDYRILQRDLGDLEAARSRSHGDAEELTGVRMENETLRRRVDELQQKKDEMQESYKEHATLRKEMDSLVDDVRSTIAKYEEAMSAREKDEILLRETEKEAAIWRKKYEAAKSELRSLKGEIHRLDETGNEMPARQLTWPVIATSQIFVKAPENEDHMPASDNGAIADIHMTAFQSSIDDLLLAGR